MTQPSFDGITHSCSLVLARRDEVRPIRTQLNIRNFLSMTLFHFLNLFTRLDVVFGDFTGFVTCDQYIGQWGKQGDGGFGPVVANVDFG